MNKKRILVVGSLNVDQCLNVKEIPLIGETIHGRNLRYTMGGKGANQACACGKLAGRVAMLGCVGNDTFGRMQIESLINVGVDTGAITVLDGETTGLAVIYVNKDGDNCIVLSAGANGKCSSGVISGYSDLISESDYILTQMEIPFEAVEYLAACAEAQGKVFILNPAPAPDSLPDSLLKTVTYLTPNETELMKLTGMPCNTLEEIKDASQMLLNRGVRNVLVTIGEKGALLTNDAGCTLYPPQKQKAIDTTAAGDTFNAAFIVGLSEGMTVENAVRFGNVCASLTVTKLGAQDAIPTREEADSAFLEFDETPYSI